MLLGYKVDVVVVVRETRAMQSKILLLLLSLAFLRTPPDKILRIAFEKESIQTPRDLYMK